MYKALIVFDFKELQFQNGMTYQFEIFPDADAKGNFQNEIKFVFQNDLYYKKYANFVYM